MVKKFFRKIFNKDKKSETSDDSLLSSNGENNVDETEETPQEDNIDQYHLAKDDDNDDPHLEDEYNETHLEDEYNESHLEDEYNESHLEDEYNESHLEDEYNETHLEDDFIEEHIDHSLPPIESELPDLPSEVLKVLRQDQSPEFDEQEEEDFDFTEIKPNKLVSTEESYEELENIEEDSETDDEEFDFTEIKTHKVNNFSKQTETYKIISGDDEHHKPNEIPFDFHELQVDLPSNKKNKLSHFFSLIRNILKNLKSFSKESNESRSFIDEQKKSQIHYAFVTLIVITCTYFSGKLTALMIMGQEKAAIEKISISSVKQKNNESFKKLEKINPLDTLATSKKPDQNEKKEEKKVIIDEKKICEKSNQKSSIGINVETIIVLQDRVKSIASVQIRNKDQYIREGDKIDGMAIIGAIEQEKVIFRNLQNGNCEYVELKNTKSKIGTDKNFSKVKIHSADKAKDFLPEDPNIKVEGNKFKINSSIRDEMMENITDVLSQARAIQIKNSDGSLSFKIVEIVPGSIYSKLNIQENDIITKINGEKIENLNEIMSLFGRIKDVKNLDLGIERDGIENDFQYSFE